MKGIVTQGCGCEDVKDVALSDFVTIKTTYVGCRAIFRELKAIEIEATIRKVIQI